MIYQGNTIKSIKTRQLLWFKGSGKHVFCCTTNDDEYLIDYTLENLEKELDPKQFFRVNRQYIAALDAIDRLESYSKGRLALWLKYRKDKEAIIVSSQKSAVFKQWLNS